MLDVGKKFFPGWKNGKLLLLVLSVMIIIHFVIFMIYSQRSQSAEFGVNREVISRQVVNFIQDIQNTPVDEQETLVKALDIPNFKITVDDAPKWDVQFINVSLWHILKEISAQSTDIQLSYLLAPDRWLNVSATIIQKTVGLQVLLVSLEVTIILAILFSFWIINRFTIPLRQVTQAAERLGVDLHSKPLDVNGPRVARVTAHAINKMQERIQDLIQARTQMLAAISHDLRTPITRLKLRAQYVEDARLYEKITKDLDEMETMIAETLAFAREDNKCEQRAYFDLGSLLSSLCDNYAEMGRAVSYEGPLTRILCYGASMALNRVFGNLIDNAVKYGNCARVNLSQAEDNFKITVDDEGQGIPPHQLKQVFQPFYRGEHSRSRETGGTGLGLAVALDIIRAHGGNIELINRSPKGLRAMVVLPRLSS